MSDDVPLTISQVCRRYPGARGARHVTPSTVTRWILTGCPARDGSRVRLPATRAGSRWLVAPSDLDAFFTRLAADPGSTQSPPARPPTQSERRALAADAELRRQGA